MRDSVPSVSASDMQAMGTNRASRSLSARAGVAVRTTAVPIR